MQIRLCRFIKCEIRRCRLIPPVVPKTDEARHMGSTEDTVTSPRLTYLAGNRTPLRLYISLKQTPEKKKSESIPNMEHAKTNSFLPVHFFIDKINVQTEVLTSVCLLRARSPYRWIDTVAPCIIRGIVTVLPPTPSQNRLSSSPYIKAPTSILR